MSILHVVDSLEVGGLERVVTDLAIAQKSRGHDVAVFSISPTTGFMPELLDAGVPVQVGGKNRAFDLDVLRKLRCMVLDRQVRVVHAHNFVPNYYAATAMLGVGGRRALVGTCHDMGTRLTNRRPRWLYRLSLTRTARLAMVGQQVHDRYVEAGWINSSRAETVLNGIPVQRFEGSSQRRAAARELLGLAAEIPVIGCVGRLVPLKNQRQMIEVLPSLLRMHPTTKLVVVGYGELEAELLEQALSTGVADQVMFLGQRSDVSDLLPAFDIFALPSLTEGLSIALLEACATGLAVVASAVGGNVQIVQHQETGLLVPVGNADALSDALMSLLNEPGLRGRLGRAAAAWVAANASVDALCTAYDEFYQRALR